MNVTLRQKPSFQKKVDQIVATRRLSLNHLNKLPKSDIYLDVIYENERGTILFNSSNFSKKALLPTDHPSFSNPRGSYVVDRKDFQCPPNWEWVSDWIIDMNGPVDDDGWSYNLSFNQPETSWKDRFDLNNFISSVRRRKWTRMRRYTLDNMPESSSPTKGNETIIEIIQQKKIDREIIQDLEKYIKTNNLKDPKLFKDILTEMRYECGKLKVCLLLASKIQHSNDFIKAGLASLKYGSDKLEFLKALKVNSKNYRDLLSID